MKFYGPLGFAEPVEGPVGVFIDEITEYNYYGDVIRIVNHTQGAEKVNDDIKMNNQISVLVDPYALENFANLRYITFNNSKWEVSAVELAYPRLIISFGGLYHEQPQS